VRIEAAWGDIMACLGYELVTRDARAALDASLIGMLAGGTKDAATPQRELVATSADRITTR